MQFLAFNFFKPNTWLSGAAEGIMGGILTAVRTFCFWLVGIIYELLVNVYNLFEKLCSARLLDNSILDAMSQRIGVVLGIIMFFYIIFSLIQMVIDPEKISNKDSGAVAIIRKAILVIVMLGMSGFVFDLLFGIQKKIMDENIISKLILPFSVDEESEENFGNLLSASLIKVFYYVDNNLISEVMNSSIKNDDKEKNEETISACQTMVNSFYAQVYKSNAYTLGNMCLNESLNVMSVDNNSGMEYEDQTYIVSFNGIVSIVVGAYMIYVLLMYCFKVGVRLIQLTFLEIISPMPIIAYMSPKKDNMFGKWLKLYFATYVDVFIRVAIINFAVYMICIILSEGTPGFQFWDSIGTVNSIEKGFLMVVLVLSLLTFAKKAPDLLKELLPAGASKLGFGVSMKDIVGLEKGVKWTGKAATGILGGAAAGAAIGLLGGGLGGFAGGLLKGGLSGLKGQGLKKTAASAWKAQQANNKRIADWKNAGGTNPFGRWGAAFNQWRGVETQADLYENEKNKLQAENAAYKSFDSYISEAEKRAESQILKGAFSENGHAQEALKQKNLAEIYRQQSATIKKSDFENAADYKQYVAKKYDIDRKDYTDDASYTKAIAEAIEKNKYTIDKYVDEQYENALSDLANKAKNADTAYLTEMKKAKTEYISYTLDVANGRIDDVDPSEADAATLQNLQQAAGIVSSNQDKGYEGFKEVSQEKLLSGNYSTFDGANNKAKGIQAENNNKLGENERLGASARADAKYSGRK